jgi:hypothetical protein
LLNVLKASSTTKNDDNRSKNNRILVLGTKKSNILPHSGTLGERCLGAKVGPVMKKIEGDGWAWNQDSSKDRRFVQAD